MGTKFIFELPPSLIQLKIALQPRVETVLFAKLFRNCWHVVVCEKLQIILTFVIHCHAMSRSSRQVNYGLILDLSHLNSFVVKQSIKYEDLRCVLQMFPSGMFIFCFDLKLAYHHIDICTEHTKFLSFKWPTGDGQMKFYEFKVLPFGLTSTPYVFTKVLLQLIKFWRGHGHRLLLYLDDGIGGYFSQPSAKQLSL